MAKFSAGEDAMNDLLTEAGEGYEFARYPVKVRVLSTKHLIKYRAYGIYKEVDTFVAENPSVYNAKGFPQSNLTPWDEASEYYSKKAFDAEDAGASEDEVKAIRAQASRYRGKERYLLGAIDLASGEPVVLDLSRNQAQAVYKVFKKNEAKLDKKAFEVEKSGSGKNTVVTTTSLDLDDLTAKELDVFEKAGDVQISTDEMYGALYEADEKEQIELLKQAKFDVSLIGLDATAGDAPVQDQTSGESDDEIDDDLPF